jgi:hypothetical protein
MKASRPPTRPFTKKLKSKVETSQQKGTGKHHEAIGAKMLGLTYRRKILYNIQNIYKLIIAIYHNTIDIT